MKPEILAPVGSMEALNAALAAGCDAVYFGLPSFGARAFANNFDLKTTKEVIERCHLCGVKVYITMNIILYEDEIEDAYNMAKKVHSFGVDALIIQDLGFIHLLHHRLPNLVLHASTQLSVSNPYQIEQLKREGRIFVIRPSKPIACAMIEKDPDHLQEIYDIGRRDALHYLEDLKKYL